MSESDDPEKVAEGKTGGSVGPATELGCRDGDPGKAQLHEKTADDRAVLEQELVRVGHDAGLSRLGADVRYQPISQVEPCVHCLNDPKRVALWDSIEENPNDLPLGQLMALHRSMLLAGWRPVRWKHPDEGDHELVASHGFWQWRHPGGPGGVRWGMKHAIWDRDVLLVKTRDEDGNLIVKEDSSVDPPTGTEGNVGGDRGK